MHRILTAALVAVLTTTAAVAHHGWRWTDSGQFELTGVVTESILGNPHGILTVFSDDETWTAQIGQPWRNDRAGLTDAMLQRGTELTLIGERSADPAQQVMKAEIIRIDGQDYVLYPDRV